MFAKVSTAHVLGITGIGVDVEADVSSVGLPAFNVVGLAEGALKESKERVKSSLKNLDYNIFARPITINLAPADFKKEGSHYDLPIALGLLAASDRLDKKAFEDTIFIGELSLDGRLKGVSGVLSMAEYVKLSGVKRLILPKANAREASLIKGIDIYPFDTLSETVAFLRGDIERKPYLADASMFDFNVHDDEYDFADIKGQQSLRRAAEIAAAGMHNLLMTGSPGSGKTMIARRLPSILPAMSLDEALETTKVHSAAGLLREAGTLIKKRPFVSPHHTASSIAIIGGGAKAKPGQVSIANCGVLFLDEMPEFSRSVLEVLRQPLEDREVTIARAGRTLSYPAKFMLVGAMNPCPCGYYGDTKKECACTIPTIERYRAKISGPLLDRIDIHSYVLGVDYKALTNMSPGEPSIIVRERVNEARLIQAERLKESRALFNSQLSEKEIKEFCKLDDKSIKILESAIDKFALSARAYSKILKTARTIADLAHSKDISTDHLFEAIQLRIPNG